jgi:hypothetical protein
MTPDIIGALYDPAEYNDKGEEVTPAKLLPGYHVNITADDMTSELEPYVVEPSPLRRVFSGDDPANPKWTVALKFKNEAEARAVFNGMGETLGE